MGKGSGNQTVTNVQALPPAVEAALEAAYTDFNPFQSAFEATDSFNPMAYSGPAMADFSPLQTAALTNAGGLISRPDYINQAQNTFGDLASGNVGVDVGTQNLATGLLGQLASTETTNPYLEQQLANAVSGAVDKATSQYALGGRLGSDSFGGALGAGITSAAAPILARNLQQDRANQLSAAQALGRISGDDLSRDATTGLNIGNLRLQAAQALPGLLAADQSRIGTLQDLGAMQQAPAQAAIDGERARVAEQNVLDQNRINALLGASGMGQGMFGTTSTQTGGGPSTLAKAAGGALTGATLASSIPALTPAMGTTMGTILALFSDNRLKEDVELLGKHPNGLNVYRWKWNKTAKRHHFEIYPTEGFMAQEARKLYPEHVYRHPTGFLMLDYAALSNEVMGAI
tara:strand:+ start:13565 stop:14773 length:1209 start_codon:yes stop_codon:yes gene_type:complete